MFKTTTQEPTMTSYYTKRLASNGSRPWMVIRSDGFVVSEHRTRAAAEKDAADRNRKDV